MADTVQDSRLLLRKRDTARDLGVSERQVDKWTQAGILPRVSIPGIRAVRYRADDVRRLAVNIAKGRLSIEAE